MTSKKNTPKTKKTSSKNRARKRNVATKKASKKRKPGKRRRNAKLVNARTVHAYNNTWSKVVPVSRSAAASVEKAIGVKMPANLKKLLTECGGGVPEKGFYLDSPEVVDTSIGRLLRLEEQRIADDVASVCRVLRDVQELPESLIPFATDGGHANVFCLDVTSGEVIYWLHDDHDRRSRLIASSLSEFIEGLTECPF